MNKKPFIQYKNSGFDCEDPFFGLVHEYVPEKIVEEKTTEAPKEPVPIPCWYILLPLSTIIIILLAVFIYHVVTSILTYRKAKQKAISK